MKALSVLGIGVLLASAVARAGDDAGKTDLKKLQGTWQVVQAIDKGEKVPAEGIEFLQLRIEGNKIAVRERDKVSDRMTFTIDAGKKPKAIDMTHSEGADKGKTDRGIYQVDGDTLKICVNEKADGDRPTEFASKAGSTHSLVVLKRLK